MEKMSKFLAVGQDFSSSPGFAIKIQGKEGTVHTWWVQQVFDIFGKKENTWRTILEDNPAGHGFLLKDLVLIELFRISHNCVTECMLQAKFLLKFISKSHQKYLFSQYVIFLSKRRGKFKLLGLLGGLPSPKFTRLVGHPAYSNDLLSKQKIYSM